MKFRINYGLTLIMISSITWYLLYPSEFMGFVVGILVGQISILLEEVLK